MNFPAAGTWREGHIFNRDAFYRRTKKRSCVKYCQTFVVVPGLREIDFDLNKIHRNVKFTCPLRVLLVRGHGGENPQTICLERQLNRNKYFSTITFVTLYVHT